MKSTTLRAISLLSACLAPLGYPSASSAQSSEAAPAPEHPPSEAPDPEEPAPDDPQQTEETSETSGQTDDATPTLLSDLRLGAYAEFGIGLQAGMNGALPDLNLGGNLMVDRRFSFGASYQWILGEPRPNTEADERLYYDSWRVGARAEYLFLHDRVFPLGVAFGGGVGEVDADFRDAFDEGGDAPFGEDLFFWVAPEVNVQAVLWDYVRARLSGGYRFTGGVDYRGAGNAELSGPFVQLSILAGYFGQPRR